MLACIDNNKSATPFHKIEKGKYNNGGTVFPKLYANKTPKQKPKRTKPKEKQKFMTGPILKIIGN